MFLYRSFLYSLLLTGSMFTTLPLLGLEVGTFDEEMAKLSLLRREFLRSSEVTITENYLQQLEKIIDLRESMRPEVQNSRKLMAFKARRQESPAQIQMLARAIKRYQSPEELQSIFSDLFQENLIFYTPLGYEQDLECNLLEYILYCGHYAAFRKFWHLNDNKSPLTKKFLIGLLQDSAKNTFIELLQESSAGQAKLSSLLTYAIKRSHYPEAWILLSHKVNPNALHFIRGRAPGFIIEHAAHKNDIVALQLLLDAHAINGWRVYPEAQLEKLAPITKKILGLNHTVSEEDGSPFDEKGFKSYVHEIKMKAFRQSRGYTTGSVFSLLENQRLGLDSSFINYTQISAHEKEIIAKHEQARRAYEETAEELKSSPRNLSELEKEELFGLLKKFDEVEEDIRAFCAPDKYGFRKEMGARHFSCISMAKKGLKEFLRKMRANNKNLIDGQSFLEFALVHKKYKLAYKLGHRTAESEKTLFLLAGCPNINYLSDVFQMSKFVNEVFYFPSFSTVRTPLEMALEQQLNNPSASFRQSIECLVKKGATLTPEKHTEYLTRIKKLGLNYGNVSLILRQILRTVPSLLSKNSNKSFEVFK